MTGVEVSCFRLLCSAFRFKNAKFICPSSSEHVKERLWAVGGFVERKEKASPHPGDCPVKTRGVGLLPSGVWTWNRKEETGVMSYTLWAQVPFTSETEKRGNGSVLLDAVPIDHNYLVLVQVRTSQRVVKKSTMRCQNNSEHMYFYQPLSLKFY